jgi:hypothetical protein
MSQKNEIESAIETLKRATASCATGDRHIVVLPHGWIFAGRMSLDAETNTYTVADCVNVRSWTGGGFGGLTKSASNANLDACDPIRFHSRALVFAVPIGEEWGNE